MNVQIIQFSLQTRRISVVIAALDQLRARLLRRARLAALGRARRESYAVWHTTACRARLPTSETGSARRRPQGLSIGRGELSASGVG